MIAVRQAHYTADGYINTTRPEEKERKRMLRINCILFSLYDKNKKLPLIKKRVLFYG